MPNRTMGGQTLRLCAALGAGVAVCLGGCGGLLLVDDRSMAGAPCETYSDCRVGQVCTDGACRDAEPCTPSTPDGEYCPEGIACVDGVCTGGGQSGWCDCPCSQGCQAGDCVGVTATSECSSKNLDGACLCGDVCVAGQCVPLGEGCSPDKPNGLCPSGASCMGGYCVPTEEDRCGSGNPTGRCPAGQACTDPGPACRAFECVVPCEDGEVCLDGHCETIPCSPNNPDGACPLPTDVCSVGDIDGNGSAGDCIPCDYDPAVPCCGVDDDCPANQRCSHADPRVCINAANCLVDADCTPYEACNTALFECERNLTCQTDAECCPEAIAGTSCTTAEICSETQVCLPQGECATDADCRSAGLICAVQGLCINTGACLEDADCRNAALICSANTCIAAGTCQSASDCPPAHVCSATSQCEPDTTNGDPCTSNAFVPPGTISPTDCDPAALRCCSTGTEADCCPQGERCSIFGDCAADPYNCLCIANGECVTDADCFGGAAGGYFLCIDYQCVAQQTDCGTCSGTDICSFAGGCIPNGACADDRDCDPAEACNANFECEMAGNCGTATFSTTLVKPNLLLVLDRSGSMQVCNGSDQNGCCGAGCPTGDGGCWASQTWTCDGSGDYCDEYTIDTACDPDPVCEWGGGQCIDADDIAACDAHTASGRTTCEADARCAWSNDGGGVCLDNGRLTRWLQALQAIDDLTYAHNVVKSTIRFGLMVYPRRCGTSGPCIGTGSCAGHDTCGLECNWCSCDSTCGGAANYRAGVVDIAVGDGNRNAINSFLQVTYPGGATPTGPTLRAVLADSAAAGLAATDRDNVIVLVTDGVANGDHAVSESGCGAAEYTCEVDAILAGLVDLPNATSPAPSLKTYVIGFAFGGINQTLNCHAFNGGTARPAECPGVNASNCDSQANACYYRADDAAALATALDDIIGSIASCAFILDPAPPDPTKLFVYLDYGANPLPAVCAGENPCPLDRDPSHLTNWDYDDTTQQIEFYTDRCDDVQGGLATPQVIYGCPGSGG